MSNQYINRINGIYIQDSELTKNIEIDKLVRDNVEHVVGHITKETLVLDVDLNNLPEGAELKKCFERSFSSYYNRLSVDYNYNILNIDLSSIKSETYYKVVVNDEIIFYAIYLTDWYFFESAEIYLYNTSNIDIDVPIPNRMDDNDGVISIYNRFKENCLKIPTTITIENATSDISFTIDDIDYEINNVKFYELTIDDEKDHIKVGYNYIVKNGGYTFPPADNSIDLLLQEIKNDYDLKLDMNIMVYNIDPFNPDLITFFNTQNLIVDYGDGTVEELNNVTKITHKYIEKGKYNLRVYSNQYLNINEIQGSQITYAEFNKLDLSQHTKLDYTFPYYCKLNCDIQITNKCTYMHIPFCTQFIDNLDFVDFSNITVLDNAFDGMCSLDHVPADWNTSKVQNWDYTFQACNSLKRIDNIDMSAATTAIGAFYDSGLEYICPINLPNLRSIKNICDSVYNLKHINMTTNNLTDIYSAFDWCFDLKTIQTLDLGDIPTTKDTVDRYSYIEFVFGGCQSLEYVKFSGTIPAATLDIVLNQLPPHDDTVRRVADISLCDNKADVTATVAGWEISKIAVEYWDEGIE